METVKTGCDAVFMVNIYLSFQSNYCLYLQGRITIWKK